MITAEQKTAWIEALRSGKYKQGTCSLSCSADTYCCLGVYAKINNMFSDNGCEVGNSQFYLPEDVMPKEYQRTLSGKNDAGESFNTIADFIEQADIENYR